MLRKTFFISLVVTVSLVSTVLLSLPTPALVSGHTEGQTNKTQSNQALLITNVSIFNGENFEGPLDLEIQNGVIQDINSTIKQNGQRLSLIHI